MNAPYKYDIVGSFLRDKEIKQAREEFSLGKITLQQLEEVENKSIENLVNEEKAVGLKAVTDGEFRRAFWHLDFLWDLKGVEKVAVEHFSIAFKGHQPKSQTLEIVDKIDFSTSFLPSFSDAYSFPNSNIASAFPDSVSDNKTHSAF